MTGVDLMVAQEAGSSAHEVDRLAALAEGTMDSADDALDDPILAFYRLSQAETNGTVDLDAELGCPPGSQVHHLGRAQQGLGGCRRLRAEQELDERLTRGRQVFVEGRIQTRSWEDRETGEKHYRTEVVCQNFQMLGQRKAVNDEGVATGESPQSAAEEDAVPF